MSLSCGKASHCVSVCAERIPLDRDQSLCFLTLMCFRPYLLAMSSVESEGWSSGHLFVLKRDHSSCVMCESVRGSSRPQCENDSSFVSLERTSNS